MFLPKEKEWEAKSYFVKTGKPLSNIMWITSDDTPENGNW